MREFPRILKAETTPAPVLREGLHELAVAYAEERFARYGGIQPTWLIAAGRHLAWIETPLEDKDRLSMAMRGLLQDLEAHAYTFIVEAYALSTVGMDKDKAEAILAHADKHGLRSLPESMRDDILMITSFDLHGGVSDSHWLVTKRRHGQGLNFLGPRIEHDVGDTGTTEGRLWNLLKPQQ